MPGDIHKYRSIRRCREMLVAVTHETADRCRGMFCPMPHDRPISDRVGASLTSGGHDCDVAEMGENFTFELIVTRSNGEATGYMLVFDYPSIMEDISQDGTDLIETTQRTIVAVASVTDVRATDQRLYQYFEWRVTLKVTNLMSGKVKSLDRGTMVWKKANPGDGNPNEDWF